MQNATDSPPAKPLSALSPEALRFHEVMESLYRKPDTYPGSVDSEAGRFLYSLVRLLRPELAVEIGTHHGISTLWIARALEDNGSGRLLALDLFEDPPAGEVQATLERAGLSHRVELVRGPSVSVGAKACRRAGRPIDFLFIDGDHRVEGCAADFETLGALMRTGGIVVFHDIYPEPCGWDGPRFVLDYLDQHRDRVGPWQAIEFPTSPNTPYGLAVLQKGSDAPIRILPRPAYWLYCWDTTFRFWLRGRRRGSAPKMRP